MIKAAIFDVDGTILDSMAIWEEVGERYLRGLHIEPEADFREIVFPMTIQEAASYTKEHYQLEQTPDEIMEGICDIVRDFYFYEAQAKEGVVSFLHKMKQQGIPMVIATSSEREHVKQAFLRLGIWDCFLEIFTCTEVGEGKTSPLIYQKAAEYLHTMPEETLVFEDAIHAIQTAARAGFVTVGVAEVYGRQNVEEIRTYTHCFLENWNQNEEVWKLIV